MAPSINPWTDLGQAYRDLYEDQHEAMIFPPYARSSEKRSSSGGNSNAASAIAGHSATPEGLPQNRGRTSDTRYWPTVPEARNARSVSVVGEVPTFPATDEVAAFYADMYRYHKKFEDYHNNGGEKPTFNRIGPEESRFARKGRKEVSGDDRAEAIGRRVHKRKCAAADEAPDETSSEEHGERERKRVGSKAKRSIIAEDTQSSEPWDPALTPWPWHPMYEEDGPEFEGSTDKFFFNGRRRRPEEFCVYVANMPEGGLPAPPARLTEEQWKAYGIRPLLEVLEERKKARAEQQKSQEAQENTTALTVS